ncbi:ribulose-phosphate 3-epimerase [Candidatus Uhrbacteria bacterium]|nr:ribulose-phosphate 3-epimerase [Candidatus Uhrbacteria bacterium]
MVKVIPAILAKTKEEFESKVKTAADFASEIQLDIMDGKFVSNITWGAPEEIKKMNLPPFEAHLMIQNPEREVSKWAEAGAKRIIAHIEAITDLPLYIEAVKKAGCGAGVAINPETSVEAVSDFLSNLDAVLVMGVNPGFSGQEFNPTALIKVAELRKLNQNISIEVDGGVSFVNAKELAEAGADGLVVANAIFKSDTPKAAYEKLLTAIK